MRYYSHELLLMSVVCVSSLVIAEIKRIVKESEIMKYETNLSPALPPG